MAQTKSAAKQQLGPPIDIIDTVVMGVARYRYWVVPFALVGLTIGLGMALIQPNAYGSGARIWVEWGARETIDPETIYKISGRQVSTKGGQGGFGMQEELALLKTTELYERIAREVGPEKLTEPIDPTRFDTAATPKFVRWQHELQDWWFNGKRSRDPDAPRPTLDLDSASGLAAASGMIRSGLRLGKSGGNIMTVSFKARSPELAQDVVAAAMKVIIERHQEIFSQKFKPEFVNDQIEEATERAKIFEEEYRKHQNECNFYDIPQQRALLIDTKMRKHDELGNTNLKLDQNLSDKEFYEKELANTSKEIEKDFEAEIVPNPQIDRLEEAVKNLRLELEQLPVKFKRGSQSYLDEERSINEQIRIYDQIISETPETVELVPAVTKNVENPDYIKLETKLRELDLEREKLLAQQIALQNDLDEANTELDRLQNCEPIHRELQDEIGDAKRKAGKFTSVLDERTALAVLDQDEELLNIYPLGTATYNPSKVGPKRGKDVLTGLMGGIIAGLAFGVLRQLLDSKLRYPHSVQKMLGVPVLGVIPEQRGWKRMGKKLRRAAAGT